MGNKDDLRPDELADRVRAAVDRLPGVAAAYLFGSQATGRAGRESDLDIGLLLDWSAFPGREDRFRARVRFGSELIGMLHRNDVDLVILNDAPPTFARAIVTRGVRLSCGDPATDHAFRRDASLRAADLAPFLARTRRAKLAALRR